LREESIQFSKDQETYNFRRLYRKTEKL